MAPPNPAKFGREDGNGCYHFGGLTRTLNVRGMWESGGRVYRDRGRQYTVSLAGWTQLPLRLDVVRWARERFRWAAVYIARRGTLVYDGWGVGHDRKASRRCTKQAYRPC